MEFSQKVEYGILDFAFSMHANECLYGGGSIDKNFMKFCCLGLIQVNFLLYLRLTKSNELFMFAGSI